MRWLTPSLVLFLSIGRSSYSEPTLPAPRPDVWETVFARDRQGNDQQIGYSHLKFEPVVDNGTNRIRVTRELRIQFKRDGQIAEMKGDNGTDETPEGKVVCVF